MKTFLHVVGARPNFMKAAPVIRALSATPGVTQILVHTGQHYDVNMSEVFFQQLGMPSPDVNLDVGSSTHAQQTAEVMTRLEPVVSKAYPDRVIVYGDVNSTVAAALVCSKLGIPVAHVEAGLRSFDREMPEEINRIVTDRLCDLLFITSREARAHLLKEGCSEDQIEFVGNTMIDTLVRMLPAAEPPAAVKGLERYALVTLHRPSNVDSPEELRRILALLDELNRSLPVVFPIHPRTRARIAKLGLKVAKGDSFQLLDPVGYCEFLGLQRKAAVVLTDSGGIQEETTYLGVPCLTLRRNTERPITVDVGTNTLIGDDLGRVPPLVDSILAGRYKAGRVPDLWDGRAAERIAARLLGAGCRPGTGVTAKVP